MQNADTLNNTTESIETLEAKARLVRKWCLVSTTEAGSGHPTSCLSAADITTVLFDKYFTYDIGQPLNIYNDRFVLSKGHAAPLLYTLFGMCGAYRLEELKSLRKFGSKFEGHPVPRFEFAEAATGSLGQGLSVGAGLALASKRDKINNTVYVLCGDGELAEGQIWEAANFASFHKLDNLVAILDINRLAQSGETMFGHHIDKYASRFRAFDFEVFVIHGHNFNEIDNALELAKRNKSGKPVAIIAKTIKGKGVSFLEDKDGWHGKALKEDDLKKALKEIGNTDDDLRFNLGKPQESKLSETKQFNSSFDFSIEENKEYATREVFGEVITQAGKEVDTIYVLDGDVKNSTFTEDFMKAIPERFVEGYIAEQNMVSVGVGLSRIGKIPVVATFGAFLTRAADQIRMARVSEANIKFVGSHVGVSIGEDGPSQMALEDIAMFGAIPDTIILQPSDAVSTARLVPLMVNTHGFVYMRTLRPKTKLLYKQNDEFLIGGSKILRQSTNDTLTVAATGITVFEALHAADELAKENIFVRVVDCYSINPVDKNALLKCLKETKEQIIITVEDHFEHGGLGDFVCSALGGKYNYIEKMAVKKISQSGTKDELMKDAEINAGAIIKKIKLLIEKDK